MIKIFKQRSFVSEKNEQKFCLRFTPVLDAMMLSRRSGNSYTGLQSYNKSRSASSAKVLSE